LLGTGPLTAFEGPLRGEKKGEERGEIGEEREKTLPKRMSSYDLAGRCNVRWTAVFAVAVMLLIDM